MPRSMAPPPSAEFSIKLSKPFSGPATHTTTIIGSPNASATITTTTSSSPTSTIEKTGSLPKDDVAELLSLLSSLRGFPSHPNKDVYGFDTKLEIASFETQWCNDEEDPAATDGLVETIVEEETKGTFKDVVDSIEAAGRQFAKEDSRV